MNSPEARRTETPHPVRRALAVTTLAGAGLFLASGVHGHMDQGLRELRPVTAFEHAHPGQELTPQLSQEQSDGYEQFALALAESVVLVGVSVQARSF